MKAEHRKELQTNALADRIGRFFKGIKSKTQASSMMIWVVVLLVVGVVGAWLYFSSKAKANRSQRLVELDRVIQEEMLRRTALEGLLSTENLKKAEKDLTALIKKYPGTEAALIARFQLAQIHLRDMGLDRLADSLAGQGPLESIETSAREYYELADENKDDPVWEPQAMMGAAKAAEAQAIKAVKHLRKAARLYADLADKYPDSAQGKEAATMVKKLKDGKQRARLEKFYHDLGDKLGYQK